MGAGCCHPILIWMLNFLLVTITSILSPVMLLTTFASRPRHVVRNQEVIGLTMSERCAVAHMAFTICAGVVLHTAMKLISTGSHRDSFYRIDKDFKILCLLSGITTLVVAILGIVIYLNRDSALTFTKESDVVGGTTTIDVMAWYRGSTTKKPIEVIRKETNVQIYILLLLIADIASLILTIVGAVTVFGCNRREKYDVEAAVTRAMLSRSSSRSSMSHSRQYRSRNYV